MIQLNHDPSWAMSRLTPRKYYPPKKKGKETHDFMGEYNPHDQGRWHHGMIYIPGVQGIGIEWGNFGRSAMQWESSRILMAKVAHPNPFHSDLIVMSNQCNARWNDVTNTWDFPIVSQSVKAMLMESLSIIEMAYFELLWSTSFELYWGLNSLRDRELKWVQTKIYRINKCWFNDDVVYDPEFVYKSFSRGELEFASVDHVSKRLGHKWMPQTEKSLEKACVNYLRHMYSPYHALLGKVPYKKLMKDIHQAIAKAYPWLAEESSRQLQCKLMMQ